MMSQWKFELKKTVLILFLLPLISCNYYRDKTEPDTGQDDGTAGAQKLEISYKAVQNSIFTPRCVSCHGSSGGVNLESYEEVVKHLEAIRQSVLERKTMPKGSALNPQELRLLKAWIDVGAPKDPVATPEPSPPQPGDPPSESAPPAPAPPPSNPEPLPPGPPISEEKLTYLFVHREVFAPRCVRCHGTSGGISLESYRQVKSHILAIKKAVLVDRSMPQDGPLTAKQYKILSKWISFGVPVNGKPPNQPLPPEDPNNPPPIPPDLPEEPEVPLAATYESIKKNVFEKRCLSCHSENGSGSRVPLVPLEELLNSPLELVIPGNAEESGLVIAITRQDERRMPPPKTGKPLHNDEIAIIKEWIQNGAKD